MIGRVKPVVIVSTGRTGTIFFANLLKELCPQAESFHERGFSRPINILTNIHLDGLAPKGVLTTGWRLLKGHEINNVKTEYYFETNTYLYGIVALAPELYPDLKVVHIIRDPRTYVRSHLNWSAHQMRSYIANHLIPFWQPNPFLIGQMSFRGWFTLPRFDRFCWIWDFKNRLIRSLENSSVPYLCVRFEDLFDAYDPEFHMNRVMQFVGLPEVTKIKEKFVNPINETTRRSFASWLEWKPFLCKRLDELCGALMHDYEYGLEPEWIEKVQRGRNP